MGRRFEQTTTIKESPAAAAAAAAAAAGGGPLPSSTSKRSPSPSRSDGEITSRGTHCTGSDCYIYQFECFTTTTTTTQCQNSTTNIGCDTTGAVVAIVGVRLANTHGILLYRYCRNIDHCRNGRTLVDVRLFLRQCQPRDYFYKQQQQQQQVESSERRERACRHDDVCCHCHWWYKQHSCYLLVVFATTYLSGWNNIFECCIFFNNIISESTAIQ